MSNDDILQRLSSFIDRKSPQPARFLYRMWADQQKAITYHELREAILNGGLSINYLLDWQQDYSNFLVESYTPLVEAASKQVVKDLIAEYGVELHDPMYSAIERYISTHGGRLIREVSTAQYQAINVLVRQAAMTDTMTVDQLARAIRPCIGLTKWQCQRTKKFYDNLIEQGYSHKKALKRQMTYAAKMHRQRAASIAETETAYAYNNAAKMVIIDAVEQGLISPEVMKEWTTADDEKVCKRCGAVDGEVVPLNETFSIGVDLPPGHPGCRCAVKYLLKAPERKLPTNP